MSIDTARVEAFFDLRSPYSYLALGPARALAQRSGVAFDWWPYVTDFQSAYGGEVEQRSSRDVAKLKYLYMDCRRLAKLQGLTVRSTTKLWDPTLASQAVLFAKARNRLWEFCDPLLAAFWRREFDLESPVEVEAALVNAGLSSSEWNKFLQGEAKGALTGALAHAERLGVFGAPTFIYKGEMFWGGDRMDLLESAIRGAASQR
ncbi:2-hydroxychromene-2-carboxylate isomerase [Variovorax sp. YR750]|uniref:2-hydroxychromene-2-carboxylate isomerase n=1 Tax=unclassified Variovorax TaxID=663243 RepID=UPI00027146A0|nr:MULTISPECIES: DsbA family protein [unclassified Variovorax]EJL67562.1 2-hydroxychromene-2-carboxylate isomerase [Variovorax sp. CF313]SEM36626.1 2-hydroxychromene-2-carboxylate isomerase [Variovorax sp. YR750]SOD30636.1 2-hydroxychromene-2-carboxylate isomerase [Variovorax sp. YR752]